VVAPGEIVQGPHIGGVGVDPGAESVLVLAGPGPVVRSGQDAPGIQTDRVDGGNRQILRIQVREVGVQVRALGARRPLKERIAVVPGTERSRGDSEAARELRVHLLLRSAVWCLGRAIEFVQKCEQHRLIDFGLGKSEGVGIAEAQSPGALAQQADKLSCPIRGETADLLRSLPDVAGAPIVGLRGQRVAQIVLAPIPTIQRCPKSIEETLLLGLDGDDALADLRFLLRAEVVAPVQIDLTSGKRVEPGSIGPPATEVIEALPIREVLADAVVHLAQARFQRGIARGRELPLDGPVRRTGAMLEFLLGAQERLNGVLAHAASSLWAAEFRRYHRAVPDRILITGGAGFLGKYVAAALIARGDRVRVLDALRPPVHVPDARPDLPPGVECIIGSVTDRETVVAALDGIDAVLHLAAYQDYLPDFSTFYAVNTVSTALLFEAIVASGRRPRRIVIAGTQAEYGEGPYRCDRHGTVWPSPRSEEWLARGAWEQVCPRCGGVVEPIPAEESSVHPHSPYAMSKRAAEECALVLGARYGIPTASARYSIIHGPGQSFRNAYSGALRAFTMQALSGRAPVVYEDGGQIRDFVWIGDAVAATVLLLDRDEVIGPINVGGDRSIRVLDLAWMVIAATGADLRPDVPGLYRVGDTRHIRSDVTRLRSLGWSPTLDQGAIVNAYVGWAGLHPELTDRSIEARRHMTDLGVLREAAAP